MIARPFVPRDKLFAHGHQHVIQRRRILDHRHSYLVHPDPCVRVKHRHRPGHSADDARKHADLKVGVGLEHFRKCAPDLVSEHLLQSRLNPFLQPFDGVTDLVGESRQAVDEALYLPLQVLQHRADVVEDLPEELLAIATEQPLHGVDQTTQGEPVQQSADCRLSLLHNIGKGLDLRCDIGSLASQFREPEPHIGQHFGNPRALRDL
ncbi:hypothetical protein QQ25_01080 [Mycolicibacterium setense]|nr:hypothetical protein QQ25_01080 [Mycolicibacterium setense]